MTTETLMTLIKKFDLYANQRGSETREELIAQMRADIDPPALTARGEQAAGGREVESRTDFGRYAERD